MSCISFFKGFQVGLIVGSTGNQNPAVCIPASTDFDELIRVFVKYVQDNPSVMQERIVTGVNRAFAAAYPCKAKQ
jgi:Rap1a immunity proteins